MVTAGENAGRLSQTGCGHVTIRTGDGLGRCRGEISVCGANHHKHRLAWRANVKGEWQAYRVPAGRGRRDVRCHRDVTGHMLAVSVGGAVEGPLPSTSTYTFGYRRVTSSPPRAMRMFMVSAPVVFTLPDTPCAGLYSGRFGSIPPAAKRQGAGARPRRQRRQGASASTSSCSKGVSVRGGWLGPRRDCCILITVTSDGRGAGIAGSSLTGVTAPPNVPAILDGRRPVWVVRRVGRQ